MSLDHSQNADHASGGHGRSGPTLLLDLPPRGARGAALEAALRAAIRDGRLAAGTRLPSTRTLALDLGVARGTVVDAFAQLTSEGYLDSRRGAGTFVRAIAPPLAAPPARAVAPTPPRFDFDPGTPDLTAFPRAAWLRALRRGIGAVPAAGLGYGDPRGREDLRRALADYLARARGVVADPELIVVCGGFRHGLALVARALLARGHRHLALEDPCVPLHRAVVAATGLTLEGLPVDAGGAQTGLLPTLAARAVVVAPAHQFPLGVALQPARRAELAAWAQARDGLVVEDDYDAELRYDRKPVGALQALAPAHVAFGGTVSKTLVPGLRVGWLVVPAWLCDEVVRLRGAEDVHVPVTVQLALAELLRSGVYEQHVRRLRSRYQRRRDRLLDLLAARAPELAPRGMNAGLSLLLELPAGGPSSATLVAQARARGVGLLALPPHYAAGRGPTDGVLVGYGAIAEHDLDAALTALGALLDDLRRARTPG